MSTDYTTRSFGMPGAVTVDPNVFTQGIDMLRVKDRRAARREMMSETILFRTVGPGKSRKFLSGQIQDVSEGGISFETETSLAEGDLIDIFFKRQIAYADTCARAEIVRANNMGACFEVGARFV
jgi:hypothetical protein